VWNEQRSEKKNLNFFIYFVGAIIIDNYLECGWRMKITAVVFDRRCSLSLTHSCPILNQISSEFNNVKEQEQK
jgi:hypothetical protein